MSIARLRALPIQSLDTADLVAAILELAERADEIGNPWETIEGMDRTITSLDDDLTQHLNQITPSDMTWHGRPRDNA